MKKWKLGALAAVLLGLTAGNAQAQLASSYGAVAEPTQPKLAGYDGGFFLQSADEAFKLNVQTRLQFQHIYQRIVGNQIGAAGTAVDVNNFRFRRARMYISGNLFKNWEFLFLPSWGSGSGNAASNFWAGEIAYAPIPEFAVYVGTLVMPLDRMGTDSSSGKGLFPEAPITSSQEDGIVNRTLSRPAFSAPFTLGVGFRGKIADRVAYNVAVGNGEDYTNHNGTKQFAFGGRLVVDILGHPSLSDDSDFAYSQQPQLAIGAGSFFDHQNSTETLTVSGANLNVTTDYQWLGSTDLTFKWYGVSLTSEAYWRKNKITTGNFSNEDFGYYAQVGAFAIPKKLELAVRAAQIFREGPDNDVWEFTGGVNWYIQGQNVKLQTSYSFLNDYDGTLTQGPLKNHTFRTMLTLQI